MCRHLIVGLGNSTRTYMKTRHSIGMVACNRLAQHYNRPWVNKRKYEADICTINEGPKDVHLLKSTLAMNINGRSVLKYTKDLKIPRTNILLLHDDLERALGKISWKEGGSAGGHNGVKSVVDCLGDKRIRRLRIGIGRPPKEGRGGDVSDYVLSPFDVREREVLDEVLSRIVHMLISEYFNE